MYKAALVALLAANTAYFALFTTTSKALDAAAWLVLLLLFQLETAFGKRLEGSRGRMVLRAARLFAAVGVLAAMAAYIFEDNVLDALNTILWIGVVALLEVEVRFPAFTTQRRRTFLAVAGVLYSGLAALVLAWALRQEWFDAYDALLWLVAFATIELDLMRENAKQTRVAVS